MTQTVIARGADFLHPGMDYARFRRAGYTFAMRYAVPSIEGKMIGATEISEAHRDGVNVGFIYETTGQTWTGGKTAGIKDGTNAREALKSLGAPESVACYHAVDVQVTEGQLNTVLDWVAGLKEAMAPYRIGVYGQWSVMARVALAYPDALRWQTRAWSNGLVYHDLNMFQDDSGEIGGIAIDTNSLYKPDSGLWDAATPPHPVSPVVKESEVLVVRITGQGVVYLYNGAMHHITSPADEAEFAKVLPVVEISQMQFDELSGGTKP